MLAGPLPGPFVDDWEVRHRVREGRFIVELPDLIQGLSQPSAYPYATQAVSVIQTHISVVFLAGPCVYKIKKPVQLDFLDFSTLERRRHFCEEEVRLNRRLAPDVYRGVVPVTRESSGPRFEGTGEVIEWAVKMDRLPDEATLEYRLAHDQVGPELAVRLAEKIAQFHHDADRGERIANAARFEVVARDIRDNFAPRGCRVGDGIHPAVLARLQSLTEAALAHFRPVMESRVARGVPCDAHGDLRVDHVYLLDEQAPPGRIVVMDCIEFNEQFRFTDPVADLAFLVMGLRFQRRDALAAALVEAYFQITHDDEGKSLLPMYVAYRAAVRGKVAGLTMAEPEIPAAERERALQQSRAFWLFALSTLEQPGKRPALIFMGGLPGTGKSTLAAQLAAQAGFQVIRSDVVRKELVRAANMAQGVVKAANDIYSPEWTDRTYAECLRQAESLLFAGQRVLVDANFREEPRRRTFLQAAARWGVAAGFLRCEADPRTVRQRLAERQGDASDADWTVYEQLAGQWEPAGSAIAAVTRVIVTDHPQQSSWEQARAALQQWGLC